MKKLNRKYGWLPDKPDKRDLLGLPEKMGVKKLPASIDLRKNCSAIQDQGNLGSCTAQAIVSVLEFLDKKTDGKYTDLSRLFLYYNERAMEGTVNQDSGANIRDGIKSVNKIGICSEKIWPYKISDFTKKPPADCFTDAAGHKSVVYRRLSTLEDIKLCLASGWPVVFGMLVFESFESRQTAKTGIVTMPAKKETDLGGHCVYTCGYNDAKEQLIVPNSWGAYWGDRGIMYLPYDYFGFCSDLWVITKENYI